MGMGMIGRALAAGIAGGTGAAAQMMGRQAIMDMEEQKMMRIEEWKANFHDQRSAIKAGKIEQRAKGIAGERVATETGALDNTGAAYDQLLAEGKMTQEQYDTAKGAITSGKGLINQNLGAVTLDDRMMGQATEDSDYKTIATLKATEAERAAARDDRQLAREDLSAYRQETLDLNRDKFDARKGGATGGATGASSAVGVPPMDVISEKISKVYGKKDEFGNVTQIPPQRLAMVQDVMRTLAEQGKTADPVRVYQHLEANGWKPAVKEAPAEAKPSDPAAKPAPAPTAPQKSEVEKGLLSKAPSSAEVESMIVDAERGGSVGKAYINKMLESGETLSYGQRQRLRKAGFNI